MKRGTIFIALAISVLQVGFAQTKEDWQKQMEGFHQKMQEMAEQLSKQFGGNSFHFDTTFVQPFDFKSLEGMPFDTAFAKGFEFRHFDGDALPFDTSFVQKFHWDGSGDMPIQIDTSYFRQFKNFDSGEFPNLHLDGEWSKGMNEMMQQLLQQLEGLDKDGDGQHFEWKEWKSQPDKKEEKQLQPKPKPAPQKKRKTTIM